MSKISIKTYDSYRFGFLHDLTEYHLEHLTKLFKTYSKPVNSVLGGRSSVVFEEINGLGSIVVKYYRRGGLIRYIIKQSYLRWGKTRGQKEYELLQKVRSLGLSAPEPIAFAYRGCMFYKGWLVTAKIKEHQTLADLSFSNENRTLKIMKEVTRQISILIKNGILHVDLHPGNVIVDNHDRVYILDFDKGHLFHGKNASLRNRYLSRWNRAVKKHRLPEILRAGSKNNFTFF
jgi:3-deoxy-D-manno-octulosonic acid kinase